MEIIFVHLYMYRILNNIILKIQLLKESFRILCRSSNRYFFFKLFHTEQKLFLYFYNKYNNLFGKNIKKNKYILYVNTEFRII